MKDRIAHLRIRPLIAVLLMGILASLSAPKSLTGDEALTIALAGESYGTLVENISRDIHMPGYYSLLWLWIRAFGDSLLALRIFAFIPVGILVYTGSRYFKKYGYLLFGLSPFLLQLSVELRMYGMLAAVGMGILISLQKVIESRSKRAFTLLAITCCAGIWLHYFAWAGALGSVLYLIIRKRKMAAAVLLLVCLIVIAPWIPDLVNQVQSFNPAGGSSSDELIQTATPVQRIAGMPFSVTGTLLRFSAGNAVFRFNQFTTRDVSVWTAAGVLLLGMALLSAWTGRKNAVRGTWVFLLAVFLPLSLLRPSARHFALAYPFYAALIVAGFEGSGKIQRTFKVLIPALSILMCIPFITRSTMPQRCTYDRDFREAAMAAGSASTRENSPLVLYLDSYSTLGVLYHLQDEGYGSITMLNPHLERFQAGDYFIIDPRESMEFLLQNTDSLVQQWGDEFFLLANDPILARGPLYGEENKLVGRGSDVISDLDLITSLERYFTFERIPLPESQGPFTLFHVRKP